MMRSRLDEQLALLSHEMIKMGALCEEAIALASSALTSGENRLAAKVVPLGKQIDQKERDIESLCMKLLLQQQPVAGDLRQISAALKMITDLKRIGDQAEDIAEIISFLNGHTAGQHTRLKEMAAVTVKMLTDSIDAYVKRDLILAQEVIDYDDVADNCFLTVKQQLIDMIAANPSEGEYALDLLMIAKYLERIGDHASNLAEWVIYAVTGEHKSEEDFS